MTPDSFRPANYSISPQLDRWRLRIERVLAQKLPSGDVAPERLHQAMRYSTLSGGKRVRGMLVYATGHLLNADDAMLDGPACAIEAMQSFSLIHDDLPALDNDDIRRGRPSCHRAFDEATAILAGDALQMFAFQQLCDGSHTAEQKVAMTRVLAEDCGTMGMIGGGSIELEVSGQELDVSEIEDLHWRKCGALIHASVLLGAYSAENPGPEVLARLDSYSRGLGIGYQISNDLLDGLGNFGMLGKSPNSDMTTGRTTFFSNFDPQWALKRMNHWFDQAVDAVEAYERSEPLIDIVRSVRQRTHSAGQAIQEGSADDIHQGEAL